MCRTHGWYIYFFLGYQDRAKEIRDYDTELDKFLYYNESESEAEAEAEFDNKL